MYRSVVTPGTAFRSLIMAQADEDGVKTLGEDLDPTLQNFQSSTSKISPSAGYEYAIMVRREMSR